MAAPKGNQYAKGNKGGGRPSSYSDKYPSIAAAMCKLGATDAELAAALDVDVTTLNRWKVQHKDFSQALKADKAVADDRVERSLYQRAMGYEHEAVKIFQAKDGSEPLVVPYIERYPPDTTAMIFWLKNRRPAEWRDKPEGDGADEAPATPVKIEISVRDARKPDQAG